MTTPPAVLASRAFWGYLNVLIRRRYLLIALPIVAATLSVALSLRAPRQYRAMTSFVPQAPQTQESGLGALASQFGLSVSRPSTASPQFYSDLLLSKEVLRDVTFTNYTATTGPRPFTGDLVKYFSVAAPDREEAGALAVVFLKNAISVSPDRGTGVVRLTVTTLNPSLSSQIASRFLELLNDYNQRRRQSQAKAEREFVEGRLKTMELELKEAENALANFKSTNRSFLSGSPLVAEESRLTRRVSLLQQIVVTLSQSRETAQIDEVRNTPVFTVIENPETFVEAAARGTVRKAAVSLVLGFLLAVVIAFGREAIAKSSGSTTSEFEEFQMLRREVLADFQRLMFWRGSRSSPRVS